jgi:orotate phosphoribosyltransferase-like protein
MTQRSELKNKAVEFRKKGLSYSEILEHIHVSQSSLSLWLKDVKLTDEQKLRLNEKGDRARKLGSMALKSDRIKRTKNIISRAKSEIKVAICFRKYPALSV